MKITEVVKELEEIKIAVGDIDVKIKGYDDTFETAETYTSTIDAVMIEKDNNVYVCLY